MAEELEGKQEWTPRRWLGGAALLLFGAIIAWKIPAETYLELWRGLTLILGTFIFGIALAYVLKPIVDFLAGRSLAGVNISRFMASLIAFVVAGLLLVGLVRFGIVPVVAEIGKLARQLPALQEELPARLEQLLTSFGEAVPSYLRLNVEQMTQNLTQAILEGLRRGAIITVGWLPLLVELLLIPILAFYFLVDTPHLLREMVLLFPIRHRDVVFSVFRQVDRAMERYIHGQMLLCLIAAAVVTGGLGLLGIDFALTFGLVAGLTRAIPVIGPVLGGIPIVIFVWIMAGLRTALIVLVFFSLMHFVESKLLLPKILGRELELHPVVVILSLLVGGELFGLLGMFVAPPITAIVRMFLVRYRHEVALKEARLR